MRCRRAARAPPRTPTTAASARFRRARSGQSGAARRGATTSSSTLMRVGNDEQPISSRVATETPAGGIANEVLAGVRLGGVIGGRHASAYHAEIDLLAGGDVRSWRVRVRRRVLSDRHRRAASARRRRSRSAPASSRPARRAGSTTASGCRCKRPSSSAAARVRLLGRGRIAMLAGTHDDGAPSLPVTGELEAMAGVRIGHHYATGTSPRATVTSSRPRTRRCSASATSGSRSATSSMPGFRRHRALARSVDDESM